MRIVIMTDIIYWTVIQYVFSVLLFIGYNYSYVFYVVTILLFVREHEKERISKHLLYDA